MGNKYYVPGKQRSERVRDLFGAIAPRYDLINDLQSFGLHRYWKRRLVALANLRSGALALDLCCGTGDVASELARRGAQVAGLDFSWPMLHIARQRLGASVTWVRGDALHIPFGDAVFDVVTISYGLRNLADYREGIMEIRRVLKPGGRVLVLDFGKPDNPVWRRLYFGYLRRAVPIFGRLFTGDADTYGYILESLLHYPAQRGVAACLEELAFSDVRVVNFLGGVMAIVMGQCPGRRD